MWPGKDEGEISGGRPKIKLDVTFWRCVWVGCLEGFQRMLSDNYLGFIIIQFTSKVAPIRLP